MKLDKDRTAVWNRKVEFVTRKKDMLAASLTPVSFELAVLTPTVILRRLGILRGLTGTGTIGRAEPLDMKLGKAFLGFHHLEVVQNQSRV